MRGDLVGPDGGWIREVGCAALGHCSLRTGVWYRDREIALRFPDGWEVVRHAPATPPPLSDSGIREAIARPIGQTRLAERARGKRAPVILVDDLNRPTPSFRVLPAILDELQAAGIAAARVRIVVATGTHGRQDRRALERKLGPRAVEQCRVVVHDDRRGTRWLGRTSLGTPVWVNRHVARSDLVLGIGGVYPQSTVGFGGGVKLVLGVLARRSIAHLHFLRAGSRRPYDPDNEFRRDLAQIARLVGLETTVSVHVDERLQVVRIACGHPEAYYDDAVRFSRQAYRAPDPGDAAVVVANAYPFDSSFLFMRKAYRPLELAAAGASRIVVASNHGGIGRHGLYQHIGSRRWNRLQSLYYRLSVLPADQLAAKPARVLRRILRLGAGSEPRKPAAPRPNYAVPKNGNAVLVYRPAARGDVVPRTPGMTVVGSWETVLRQVRREQQRKHVRVVVYTCAALQCIERPHASPREAEPVQAAG